MLTWLMLTCIAVVSGAFLEASPIKKLERVTFWPRPPVPARVGKKMLYIISYTVCFEKYLKSRPKRYVFFGGGGLQQHAVWRQLIHFSVLRFGALCQISELGFPGSPNTCQCDWSDVQHQMRSNIVQMAEWKLRWHYRNLSYRLNELSHISCVANVVTSDPLYGTKMRHKQTSYGLEWYWGRFQRERLGTALIPSVILTVGTAYQERC